MSKKHSNLISEMLCRISELVLHIADLQLVNLPVKMMKREGRYWLSFHNDETKLENENLLSLIFAEFMNFTWIRMFKKIHFFRQFHFFLLILCI